MAGAVDSWDSAENARRYAEFVRRHKTYRQTSRDVVSLALASADATIVDLACGTGITTEAVLSVLGENGQVIAVYASEAMLAAQLVIQDQRGRWLHSSAERINDGTLAGADAVVCNSAIWQIDVQATTAAVRRVLRPGPVRVHLAAAMLTDHVHADQPDPLMEAMKTIAARDYGWIPADLPACRGGARAADRRHPGQDGPAGAASGPGAASRGADEQSGTQRARKPRKAS